MEEDPASASGGATPTDARGRRRARSGASVALAILAAATMVVGGVCLYLRQAVFSSSAFADRSVAALVHEPVQRVVAREIAVQVIDQGSSDLIAARPLINSVVEAVVATPPFGAAFRVVAEQETHRRHSHSLAAFRSRIWRTEQRVVMRWVARLRVSYANAEIGRRAGPRGSR